MVASTGNFPLTSVPVAPKMLRFSLKSKRHGESYDLSLEPSVARATNSYWRGQYRFALHTTTTTTTYVLLLVLLMVLRTYVGACGTCVCE